MFGLLRCDQIIAPGGILPFSKAQFWVLVKKHAIPVVKLSPKVTAFWVHDLRRAFFGDENASPLAQDSSVSADPSICSEATSPFVEQSLAAAPHVMSSSAISKATVNFGGRRPVSTPVK